MNYTLMNLGFSSHFEQHFLPFQQQGFAVGRIATENKNQYTIFSESGILQGEVSGKLLFTANSPADFPKTGDWIVMSVFEQEQKAIIHEVLPRISTFSRKVTGKKVEEQIIAANINLLFIVQSLDANFNLRRLERYLVMAHESGAKPVIVLNKVDLCKNLTEKLTQVKQISQDTPVVALSGLKETGLEQLEPFMQPGVTIAFTGSSGVGKSTIINKLLGSAIQETSEVREVDAKGRHTTTRRELIVLPNGTILIDTPGMRELQLWNASEGLDDTFADIADLSSNCRFSDCTHTVEKGCAVIEAINQEELPMERYNSFMKLQKELAYLAVQQDQRSLLAIKQRDKRIHKQYRQIIRNKNRQ
ncbi:ribosome small subunit-dependent GTPase A [Rhodocytophaga rosea]|uniref:Small ribosomal subunit biogenesis GTPase RsgA n=1 Tax=Rhodocytophaga rosea TaxID=2704465 RepID=A0A6C0GJ12_9BACT|nr:ribosome small subunit-dependent GTPase A [Rhodocytophaga rosea]QHT68018.1 ribosome small subunit-dependent GTPase A [Rhodocytophaga rosea]